MPPLPFAAAGVSFSVVLYRLVPAARNCSAEPGTRYKSWEDTVDLPPLDQSGSWDRIRVDILSGRLNYGAQTVSKGCKLESAPLLGPDRTTSRQGLVEGAEKFFPVCGKAAFEGEIVRGVVCHKHNSSTGDVCDQFF